MFLEARKLAQAKQQKLESAFKKVRVRTQSLLSIHPACAKPHAPFRQASLFVPETLVSSVLPTSMMADS